MAKPICSLSLDLDNQWSYMKTHGDPGWETFPSYLDLVVPRVLEILRQFDWKITFFIVGQDAALEKNRDALASIARGGPRDRQPQLPPRALATPLHQGPNLGRDRPRRGGH